ncbi:MAG: hypothetical protein ACKPJD_05915, partial [Planctomycetaceae bacterium]
FLRSSGFPARALRLASGASGDCGTVEVALGAVWLTRSREGKRKGQWELGVFRVRVRVPSARAD